MKQAFLVAYEDSGNEEEEGSDNEAISLYAVIESEEPDKCSNTSSSVQLGMHVETPPLFDGHHFDEWKMRMEVFLQTKDYDLWEIIRQGPRYQ